MDSFLGGNLELYGGPADGHITEMPLTPKEGGGVRRPRTITVLGETYLIEPIEKHPLKHPCLGVTHVGVFRANRI